MPRPSQFGWELHDDEIAYFRDAVRRFELLKRILVELSGLALIDSLAQTRDSRLTEVAALSQHDLREAVPQREAPASCRRAHLLLDRCATHLRLAISRLNGARRDVSDVLTTGAPLFLALSDLQAASTLVPGVDLVDRSSACCADLYIRGSGAALKTAHCEDRRG